MLPPNDGNRTNYNHHNMRGGNVHIDAVNNVHDALR